MREWKMEGKPALVLLHYQEGIIGKGEWIQGWYEPAKQACIKSGMFENTKALLDAFREKDLPVVFVNAIPNPIGKLPLMATCSIRTENTTAMTLW